MGEADVTLNYIHCIQQGHENSKITLSRSCEVHKKAQLLQILVCEKENWEEQIQDAWMMIIETQGI
jgi:hypothetical protein